MAVVCQAEAIVTGAAVVPGDVDTLVDAACVVLPLTLIHIFTVLSITSVAGLADALVGLGCVLADGINVTTVSAFHALIHILTGFICQRDSRVEQKGKHAQSSNLQRSHCNPRLPAGAGARRGISRALKETRG